MRQLMKTCLFAFTDIQSVVRADLHSALTGVSVATSAATDNGYRVGATRKRSHEPLHPLDGMDVSYAMPMIYYLITFYKYCAG
jgi:mannose-6-phosphate isomerase class I